MVSCLQSVTPPPMSSNEDSYVRVVIYPAPEIKERLKRLADSDRRSMSQMAAILIEEGLDRWERRMQHHTTDE